MKANTFPVTPFETFVVAKDVWVEVPVPYGTGTWTNGTASDTQFGVGFHAETPDNAKTSIDLKYTKVLEEDGWTKKDIKTLNTIHEKIKKDKLTKAPEVCRTCPFVDYCDDKENCKHRKELENRE